MSYTSYNYKKSSFNPKKAVKKFSDLEVYQKSLEGSVFVCGELTATFQAKLNTEGKTDGYLLTIEEAIIQEMSLCALSIPRLIAESHSKRFGAGREPLEILDIVMHKCNAMVVYLEQARDILETGISTERFEEQVNKYFLTRRKVLNLQRAWRKSIEAYEKENKEN